MTITSFHIGPDGGEHHTHGNWVHPETPDSPVALAVGGALLGLACVEVALRLAGVDLSAGARLGLRMLALAVGACGALLLLH